MKKIIAIIIAMTIALSLLPVSVGAVSSEAEKEIKQIVSGVIKGHAAKVAQVDSADKAFSSFFSHGFYGNGKSLTLRDDHPMVAALFNSYVMQEALVEGITAGIAHMQETNTAVLYCGGGPQWHNFYYSYIYDAFRGEEESEEEYICRLIYAGDVYDSDRYEGPVNENDEVMELLVGGLGGGFILRREEVGEQTAVYSIELRVQDLFDFDGDYSAIKDKGIDTSKDDTLNNLGFLLTFLGLDAFQWEYSVDFRIEVPYECDHLGESYRWVLDASAHALNAQSGEGLTVNPAAAHERVDEKTGEIDYYYELEQPLLLKHDADWVMEYDVHPGNLILFNSVNRAGGRELYYFQSGKTTAKMVLDEYISLDEPDPATGRDTITKMHFMGVITQGKMAYSAQTVFTYRLENEVYADGSNMVYLTVLDRDSGEVLLERTAMDDYHTRTVGDSEDVLVSETSDALSGYDLKILYIGNKDYAIKEDDFELRIYEHADEQMQNKSRFKSEYRAPACTERGGMLHTCQDCGFSYLTEAEPALGHSFGEYVYDGNASCTADGTETAVCALCGERDTIIAEGTATGHSYEPAVTEPTCTADGFTTYTCRCGDSYTGDTVKAKGHVYTAAVTAPTCGEGGFTVYTCDCGHSYRGDETEPAGHTEVMDPAVEATCQSKGLTEGAHCGVCGAVLTEQKETPTAGHLWDEGTVITKPTAEAEGVLAYSCVHCGQKSYLTLPVIPDAGFADVSASDYFADAVNWAAANKITGGVGDGLFGPHYGCTRAQVVTFLWAANGKPTPETAENPFTDVSESDYYYKAVLWAVENGITGGVGDGLFAPHATCTRGQIVTFLWAAEGKPEVNGSSAFGDVSDSDWYAKPVLWAAENSVTGGIGDGLFGPNQTCTRGQVVTFLHKCYG